MANLGFNSRQTISPMKFFYASVFILSSFTTTFHLVGQIDLELSGSLAANETEDNFLPLTLEERISTFEGIYITRPSKHAGNFESLIVDFSIDGFQGKHMALRGPVISLKGQSQFNGKKMLP